VQKTLELAVITAFGFWLRSKLSKADAGVVQKLLMSALVPAVLFTSLSSVKVGIESLNYVAGGIGLVLTQIVCAHVSAYTVFGFNAATMTTKALELRRTAAMELGTCAPALSVFAFITEFVGPAFTGFAALIDLPMKSYILLIMPSVLRARAPRAEPSEAEPTDTPAASGGLIKAFLGVLKAFMGVLKDPFNAAIIGGITLSVIFRGNAMAHLGFVGVAFKSLAAAQTPVLFLLIGLKLSIEGATPNLCAVLLLRRQGLILIAVKTFIIFSGIQTEQIALLVTLASQAATSVVALGYYTRLQACGYSPDFAFDIIGISFPLTILFNTAACLGGSAYIANMYPTGLVLLALSGLLYKVSSKKIADALKDSREAELQLPLR
jgi:hypothetical protein